MRQLISFVPIGQQECQAREQTALERANEETADNKSTEVVNEPIAHARDAPAQSDNWHDSIEMQPFH